MSGEVDGLNGFVVAFGGRFVYWEDIGVNERWMFDKWVSEPHIGALIFYWGGMES